MSTATVDPTRVDPKQIELREEARGALTLIIHGPDGDVSYGDVRVRRAFPLTARGGGSVSFVRADGSEIAMIRDANDLDSASREVLRRALEIAYFIPRITRVLSIKEEYGIIRWEVETDRGRRQFEIQSRYDIRPLEKGRYLIRDIDGNRYEIPDVEGLDEESRAMIDLEL